MSNTTSNDANQEIKKRIHRASMLMVASILLSRVIGFFREWVIAHTVGATAMTDVYYASFTIPDFLNYLMAAGALSISFIPILSKFQAEDREDVARRVFRTLLGWMGGTLVLLIVLGEIFTEPLARVIAPGFSVEQTALLVDLLRVILPAQLFFYMGGLAIAVQHTHGKFFLPALAPLIYNVGIIACGAALHDRMGVAGFSVGVVVGAFCSHALTQWWGIRQLGYSMLPQFSLTPEVKIAIKRYLWLTLPLACSFSLVVTDEWIGKYFASQLGDRALSWLAYARTEMRIPIAVIGQAAGVASFPYLARQWSSGNRLDYANTLLREIKKLWAAAPLAAVVLYTQALPITHFIYGGGKFTPEDLRATAYALQMFSFGVFFWTVQVLLSRGFYACQITWLPSILGGVVSVLAIPLYGYLAETRSFGGLALAGSIGIAVYSTVLWWLLRRHLMRNVPEVGVSLRKFYAFCIAWSGVIVLLGMIALQISQLHIYQASRISALAEIALVTSVVGGTAIVLLRTVFRKWTDGALY